MNTAIELKKVTFTYQSGKTALRNISFKVESGSFTGIIGRNGSGKTTLVLLLNGLIPHMIPGKFEGQTLVFGMSTRDKPVSYLARSVSIVFQNPDLSIFNLTVEEEVSFALKNLQLDRIDERIRQSLKTVGLSKFLKKDPHMLSYGEKQKLSIACALATDSPILILDEPSAMLDFQSAGKLYEFLGTLHRSGKTVVVVEHDTDFLRKYSTHTAVLDDGRLVSYGLSKDVLKNKKMLTDLGLKAPGS